MRLHSLETSLKTSMATSNSVMLILLIQEGQIMRWDPLKVSTPVFLAKRATNANAPSFIFCKNLYVNTYFLNILKRQ